MNPQQLQKMMKQAQKLQAEMGEEQTKLEKKEFSYTAGGGAIDLVMLGSKKIVSIKIKEELLDVEEKDMLEDLLVSAFNTLSSQIDEQLESKMGKYTKGLPF